MAKFLIIAHEITPVVLSLALYFNAVYAHELHERLGEAKQKVCVLEEENKNLKSVLATMQGIQKR